MAGGNATRLRLATLAVSKHLRPVDEYWVRPSPDGLAQAFILGRRFIGATPSALVEADKLASLAQPMRKNGHGQYLLRLREDRVL